MIFTDNLQISYNYKWKWFWQISQNRFKKLIIEKRVIIYWLGLLGPNWNCSTGPNWMGPTVVPVQSSPPLQEGGQS